MATSVGRGKRRFSPRRRLKYATEVAELTIFRVGKGKQQRQKYACNTYMSAFCATTRPKQVGWYSFAFGLTTQKQLSGSAVVLVSYVLEFVLHIQGYPKPGTQSMLLTQATRVSVNIEG